MKKLIVFMLALTLAFGMVGCTNSDTPAADTPAAADETEGKTPLDLINQVWDSYAEDEKFPAGGGDYESMSYEGPAAFDVSKTEDLNTLLGVQEEEAGLIDDGASIMHAMNQNTFTGAVFHLAESGQAQTFADTYKESLLERQWMCGFPDTVVVYSIGDNHVFAAFGNAEMIDTFKEKVEAAFETEVLLVEEPLSF